MTTVRETRRADELKPGDWLAAESLGADTGPTEVLGVYPFADADGQAVLLVYANRDGRPVSVPADAGQVYEMAMRAELNAGREQLEAGR